MSGFSLGHNHRRILEVLRLNGPLPRIDIAAITDLQPATLTRLSQDLIDWGFLEDVAYGSVADARSSAKRKTRLLRIDNKRLFTVGIAATLDRIACSLSSLGGDVVAETTLVADMLDPVDVASKAVVAIKQMRQRTLLAPGQVVAAGLSLPINFSDDPERVFIPGEWPLWRGSTPREIFTAALGIPVWVANDGHAAVLAEAYFGAAIGMESFAAVYLGYGIGGGMMIDRRLYIGTHGNAGAFGSLFPQTMPRPAGRDLLRHLADHGIHHSTLFELDDRLADDPRLVTWIERAADQLLPIVRHAQVLLNCEAVIFGGLLPPRIMESLVERLRSLSADEFAATKILASSISPQRFHLGAACLPQYEMTAPRRYSGPVVKGAL